jgi:molybdopterin adenylyltransferase
MPFIRFPPLISRQRGRIVAPLVTQHPRNRKTRYKDDTMRAPLVLSAETALEFSPGQRLSLLVNPAPEYAVCLLIATGRAPRLPVGTVLTAPNDGPVLQILANLLRPGDGDLPASPVLAAKVLSAGRLPAGETTCSTTRSGPAIAWITLSDKGSQGLRTDTAGPAIAETCAGLSPCLVQGHIIPDDPAALKALLTDLALTQGFDLVVTTGGTGLGPRDTTPEATLAVLEKRLPGFETAMTLASLAKTPHAMISRAVAGTLGPAILLNLPGSPKAVRENLTAVLPALPHALAKLHGDPADCAA